MAEENWRRQIYENMVPLTLDDKGLLVSTNVGYFSQKQPHPIAADTVTWTPEQARNQIEVVKGMRRDGNRPFPTTPFVMLTKGYTPNDN